MLSLLLSIQILLHVGSIVWSRHNLENEKINNPPPQTFHLNAIKLGVLNEFKRMEMNRINGANLQMTNQICRFYIN